MQNSAHCRLGEAGEGGQTNRAEGEFELKVMNANGLTDRAIPVQFFLAGLLGADACSRCA